MNYQLMTQLRGMHAELQESLDRINTLDPSKVNPSKKQKLEHYLRILQEILRNERITVGPIPALEQELRALYQNHPELTHVFGVYQFEGRNTVPRCPAYLKLNLLLPQIAL